MRSLLNEIKTLQNSSINKVIENRLLEFSSFENKPSEEWFSELCFCILAANAKQKTSELIQKQLGKQLLTMPQAKLAKHIRDNKHRFHNNKSKYIVQARKHKNIKNILENHSTSKHSRDFLVNNIKGIGMKEASHFLRNTGTKDLAILDRHILKVLSEHKIINEIPKTLTPKKYLEIEEKFINLANKLNMSAAKLDLFMWYLKTNEVAK